MEQVLEKVEKQTTSVGKKGKFDLEAKMKMTPNEQMDYMQLHWNEIQARVKAFDEKMAQLNITLTEDEIADMVSKDRREQYETSHRY